MTTALDARHDARQAPAAQTSQPLFRFGGAAAGSPLAIVGGGLILDLGEAERTFIYRCQDRFLAYSSLWGLRSVFFVANNAHMAIYRAQIALQRQRFECMRRRTGLFAATPLLEPLYVGCDIDRLRLFACAGLREQLNGLPPLAGVALNQISPRHGVAITTGSVEAAGMAALAMRCADKADYLALAATPGELPPHVPTALMSAAEFLSLTDYDALAALYRDRCAMAGAAPQRLFVKATLNSAGNLSALVERGNFGAELLRLGATLAREAAVAGPDLDRQVAALRREIDDAPCLRPLDIAEHCLHAFKSDQARRRQNVSFLVQPEVRRGADDDAFASIGLSYRLGPQGAVVPICASAQLYRDADCKDFQGAYLADNVAGDVSPIFTQGMLALCRLYATRGYRGPISFDARRNGARQYELIFDCNPRLTGVFPALAVRDSLRQSGVTVRSVLTLGYRGEFVLPDLDAALASLDDAALLCTVIRQRGAVLLPNHCRHDGFDLHLVNVEPDEANWLLSGAIGALSSAALHPSRLHF